MISKRVLLLFCFCRFFVVALSQQITISGYVQDAETGERLIGANIVELNTNTGTTSNNYGFYSLILSRKDSAVITVSFVGYRMIRKKIAADRDQNIDFSLHPGDSLEAVTVVGHREVPIERRDEMSMVSIPVKQTEALPALGGEPDIMKTLQLMPGVQSGNEGSSGLYVRGGSPDQNLILMDDVPLYYVNHLGGFVSIFNTDAIRKTKLIKGGYPAYYGGRLSSILDVRMKEGNMKKFHGSGMIGMIASKIAVEGPLKKNSTSYLVSYRRFLYDLFTMPLTKMFSDGYGFGYHFYDLNAKINHVFSPKDRLFLSLYSGDDQILVRMKLKALDDVEKAKASNRWGNRLVALRWNHLYNPKLFSNLTFAYTRYRFKTEMSGSYGEKEKKEEYYSHFVSGIYDANAKMDFEYYVTPGYKIKFGVNGIYHTFRPGVATYRRHGGDFTPMDTTYGSLDLHALEGAAYMENVIKAGSWFQANIGLRLTGYRVDDRIFWYPEPRVLFNVLLTENMSLKASYAAMQQNAHLLTASGAGIPVDLWMPSTVKAPPERSDQVAVGLARTFKNGAFDFSVEGYYKQMRNLIAYKEGINGLGSAAGWERKIETGGEGASYGLEFLLRKNTGKTTGWIGYTLSKTTRQFENINFGNPFPYKYDRRHDLSIVVIHKLNQHINISATWVFGTGNAFTLPLGKYDAIDDNNHRYPPFIYDKEAYIYSERNAFRMRPYHRLDVGVNFTKKKKWGERTWNVSVYNVYNRQNPYYYFFDTTASYDWKGHVIEGTQHTVLKQQSLFPVMPSVSYRFKF